MGVGAFTTGDTAGAVLHISGVNATNETLIVEGSDGTDYLTVGLGGHITASGNISTTGTFFLGSDTAETHAIQGVSSLTANGGGFIGNSNGIIRGGSSEAIKHFFCGYLDEGDGGTFEQMFIDVYGGHYLATSTGVTKYQITSRGDDQEGDYEIYRQRYGSFTQDPKFDLLILRKADEDFKRYAVFVVSTSTSFPNFSVRAWKLTNDTTNQMQEIRVKQFDSGSFPGYADGESFVERYNTLEVNRNKISGSSVSTGSFGRVDIADKLFVGGSEISSGGSTNAAGSDTQVQFNDGGTNFGGDAGFTYNKNTNSITAINHITASGNISASGANNIFNGIGVDQDIGHNGDTNTKIRFTTDNISINAGGNASNFEPTGLDVSGQITASGNISSSGNVIGNLYQPTFHNFVGALTDEVYIPFPTSTSDGTSTSYTREWLAPFDGSLSKIRFRGETAARNTTFKLYVNAVIAGGATATSDTVNAGLADTTFTYTFDESVAVYSAGDLLRVTMNPQIAPGDVNLTMIWNYNTNTL